MVKRLNNLLADENGVIIMPIFVFILIIASAIYATYTGIYFYLITGGLI